MEWTEEAIGQLRILWAEGHSTAEIGRRMGISKNAVVGKAHRLGLVARPSPIRRDAAGESVARLPSPRRVSGPTLPPLQRSKLRKQKRPGHCRPGLFILCIASD